MNAPIRRADFGPRVVLQRGERVEAEVPDLDRPHVRDATVKAARRVCVYDRMWKAGTLSDDQRHAADCYAGLLMLSTGAEWREDGVHVRKPPWMAGHPTLTALTATEKLRAIDALLPDRMRTVVWWVVVDNYGLEDIAKSRHANPQVVRGWVDLAFSGLAEAIEKVCAQSLLDGR